VHGDADKWSASGRSKRTSDPHRAAVGIDRLAPSNRRAGAQSNSSPVLSPLGSAVLNLFLSLVAQWPDSLIIVQPETSCAGAERAGQRFGDIELGVAGAVGARGFPVKSAI